MVIGPVFLKFICDLGAIVKFLSFFDPSFLISFFFFNFSFNLSFFVLLFDFLKLLVYYFDPPFSYMSFSIPFRFLFRSFFRSFFFIDVFFFKLKLKFSKNLMYFLFSKFKMPHLLVGCCQGTLISCLSCLQDLASEI